MLIMNYHITTQNLKFVKKKNIVKLHVLIFFFFFFFLSITRYIQVLSLLQFFNNPLNKILEAATVHS